MRRRTFINFLLIIVLTFGFSWTYAQTPPPPQAQTEDNYFLNFEELVKVVKEVKDKYVDEVTLKDLLHNAFRGILEGLDPYSQYIGPEELEELRIETEGEFGGLGIEVIVKDGILTVITPIIGSPAFNSGVLIGDKILKIEDESTENISIRSAIKRLRGKPGSEVTITVLHEGDTAPVDITIERAIIHVKSVRGARIVDEDNKIGYFALTSFQENTLQEMDTAVKELLDKGMSALIIDLRFNPGGLLDTAVAVADRFIKEGVIVSTKGREESQNVIYMAKGKDTYPDFPLIALVNNGSASASEIVAGAIKDHKRGLLLGLKTFGKGSVQSLIPIEEGKSALKLTTAKYYTPSGASIHELGIEPDIKVELALAEVKALHEHLSRVNVGDIRNNGGNQQPQKDGEDAEKTKFVDAQLERAVNVMKGIQIYSKQFKAG
ncbi:MAG TPA: S41 family peptidase [Candidatus Brocadiia bacterium]|nr:S41 family peptidase [Planctomycetota bacterium]MBI4007246.1 S41 family peptidase [Planctomycetota bacterium]MDO8093181.1 S41 family peptidase [Candidatus Brocadiales bacterium]